jgi:hypothetical protein
MRASFVMLGLLVACSTPKSSAHAPDSEELMEPTEEESSAPESPAEDPAEERAEAPRREVALPSRCAGGNGMCTPPADFVERLCASGDPNVALAIFQKSTPWTRAYLRRDMEAWYVNGHRQSPKRLRFGEEVIIVADRSKTADGVQVSNAGSFDVYRWDGSCVSLMSDEVSLRAPTTPEVAPIPWKELDVDVQAALERDERIGQRNEERREACKELGEEGQQKCERAHLGLSRLIAEYVRSGAELPLPTGLR